MKFQDNSKKATNVSQPISMYENWGAISKLSWSQINLKLRQMNTEIVDVLA